MSNAPVTKGENPPICWEFSAHAGCGRGAACAFAHTPFLPSGLHWVAGCEMIRRGRRRKGEKISPGAVGAKVLAIRTANARIAGEHQVSSNVNDGFECACDVDFDRLWEELEEQTQEGNCRDSL